MHHIVMCVWTKPVFVSSNFARRNAPHFAAAASLGYITTQIRGSEFGRQWRVTTSGLRFIEEN